MTNGTDGMSVEAGLSSLSVAPLCSSSTSIGAYSRFVFVLRKAISAALAVTRYNHVLNVERRSKVSILFQTMIRASCTTSCANVSLRVSCIAIPYIFAPCWRKNVRHRNFIAPLQPLDQLLV